MQLSQDQISQLYTFTRQHFVEWYDLQTELVDHLANDIEAILQDNPKLTFHEAKERAFSKFGIFGFHDIVVEKQNTLSKKYWKMVWSFLKDYFKLPKIILTIVLIGLFYNFLNLIPQSTNIISVLFLCYFLIIFVLLIFNNRKIKIHQKETGKKWLFERTIASLGGFVFIVQGPIQIFQLFNHYSTFLNTYYILFFAIFFVLFGFFLRIAFVGIPKQIEAEIVKEFPEYNQLQKA